MLKRMHIFNEKETTKYKSNNLEKTQFEQAWIISS